ncbi:serine protease, putative (macronuclear) [Tetrahymena thermophila SB210]|uniref:Serine protease, putative n=1 Tax=Tetrahymena thermophila (strain SB210) TaxID=312017 RepID=W7XF46_TETTS|nr:serine protease, putative [Tetrahymena thermophila SB210]EWS75418.1 serine protease, putative [Tetrahymena thermophila SB210]|eukprot:XP_012652092.1 serine protease, putative [Tetrahymena thermophila SB210]
MIFQLICKNKNLINNINSLLFTYFIINQLIQQIIVNLKQFNQNKTSQQTKSKNNILSIMKLKKQIDFIVFLLKIFTILQPIESQTSPCDPQKNSCCDQSCFNCSQNQISQCLACNSNYFYLNIQYQCLKTCPQGTYLDQNSNQCIACASQYCNQCSSNQCFQCKDGFYKDSNDPQNCISQCSQLGQIQDEEGQCNYGCDNDQIYNTDYQSFSCQVKIQCPQIQQIPQIQNQNNIVSSLLDKTMTILTLIDVSGNVVQYSYPQLQIQSGYLLNITSYQQNVNSNYSNQK